MNVLHKTNVANQPGYASCLSVGRDAVGQGGVIAVVPWRCDNGCRSAVVLLHPTNRDDLLIAHDP